jgi:regulator of sigma E protease
MNVVLAVLLLTIVIYVTGIAKAGDPGTLVQGFVPGGVAKDAGLQPADRIVAVDGNRFSLGVADVKAGSPAALAGIAAHTRILQIDEDSVSVPSDLASHIKAPGNEVILYCIDADEEDIAKKAQIIKLPLAALPRPSDVSPEGSVAWCRDVLGLRFEPLDSGTVISYVSYHPDTPVKLTVQRQGSETTLSVTPQSTSERMPVIRPDRQLDTPWQKVGRIGILLGAAREPVPLGAAVRMGFSATGDTLMGAIQAFRAMIRRQVSVESASGPIGIMAISYETAKKGWMEVLSLCGMVSVSLAVVNLLPIPPFDGFHIVLLGFEGLIRRRIDARLQVIAMVGGFIFVISLILVLSYKDIWNIAVHGSP